MPSSLGCFPLLFSELAAGRKIEVAVGVVLGAATILITGVEEDEELRERARASDDEACLSLTGESV